MGFLKQNFILKNNQEFLKHYQTNPTFIFLWLAHALDLANIISFKNKDENKNREVSEYSIVHFDKEVSGGLVNGRSRPTLKWAKN